MPVGTDLLEEMVLKIANGDPMPKGMSEERQRVWKKLKKEIRDIEEKGGHVDVPFESPG